MKTMKTSTKSAATPLAAAKLLGLFRGPRPVLEAFRDQWTMRWPASEVKWYRGIDRNIRGAYTEWCFEVSVSPDPLVTAAQTACFAAYSGSVVFSLRSDIPTPDDIPLAKRKYAKLAVKYAKRHLGLPDAVAVDIRYHNTISILVVSGRKSRVIEITRTATKRTPYKVLGLSKTKMKKPARTK